MWSEIERKNLPEIGRYNAGQKLLFFTLVVCLIGLLLSGIVIWRVYFSEFFSIGVIRAASLLHAFFFAFNPDLRHHRSHLWPASWVKGSISRHDARAWLRPAGRGSTIAHGSARVGKGIQSK